MQPVQYESTYSPIHEEIEKIPVITERKFIPTGAMVFFILLIILCLVIWFGIYFLMLSRI